MNTCVAGPKAQQIAYFGRVKVNEFYKLDILIRESYKTLEENEKYYSY